MNCVKCRQPIPGVVRTCATCGDRPLCGDCAALCCPTPVLEGLPLMPVELGAVPLRRPFRTMITGRTGIILMRRSNGSCEVDFGGGSLRLLSPNVMVLLPEVSH